MLSIGYLTDLLQKLKNNCNEWSKELQVGEKYFTVQAVTSNQGSGFCFCHWTVLQSIARQVTWSPQIMKLCFCKCPSCESIWGASEISFHPHNLQVLCDAMNFGKIFLMCMEFFTKIRRLFLNEVLILDLGILHVKWECFSYLMDLFLRWCSYIMEYSNDACYRKLHSVLFRKSLKVRTLV